MEVVIIGLLILGSIIGLTLIIERGLALRIKKVIPKPVVEAVQRYSGPKDDLALSGVCQQNPSPLSRLLLFAQEHKDWPKADNVDVLQTRARHEIVQLERGLVILEIIIGAAPLMGLVGTIYGLITLFGGVNLTGQGAEATIAKGIAIALNATLLGLITAIPSLVAWSYYSRKVDALAVEMENLCGEFLRKAYRDR